MPNKIAIIGGGFGGVYTLLELQKRLKNEEIFIFNKESDFVFTPLLHEAATGGVSTDNIVVPIRSFIKSHNTFFIKDVVTGIDPVMNTISTLSCDFEFDYLVIATGSDSNTHDIEGVSKYCLFLKNIDDALSIKRKIISNLEQYCISKDTSLLSFTVIGGGPTGVELAFEIDDYISTTLSKYFRDQSIKEHLRVNLVCSSERILSSMPASMQEEAEKLLKSSKINFINKSHVTSISQNTVMLSTGRELKTSAVIWCAGVRPVLPKMIGDLNRTVVNADFTVGPHKHIFALGDCVNYGTQVPMDAQAAVKQAVFVTKFLTSVIQGNVINLGFKYKATGQLISLGKWRAAGVIMGLPIKGAFAWWVWRTIYLVRFPSISKKFKIMIDWTVSIFSERDMSNI
jgi:NADH dehydrogenase